MSLAQEKTYEKRKRNIAHVARMTGSHDEKKIDDTKSPDKRRVSNEMGGLSRRKRRWMFQSRRSAAHGEKVHLHYKGAREAAKADGLN